MKFNVAINDTSSLCGVHKLLFFPMISSVRYEISTVHIVYAVFFIVTMVVTKIRGLNGDRKSKWNS